MVVAGRGTHKLIHFIVQQKLIQHCKAITPQLRKNIYTHVCMCVYIYIYGFPGGTSSKEPACQCKRLRKCGFDPWIRKIPWRRAWHPTPVFLPGESHGQRSLAGYSP